MIQDINYCQIGKSRQTLLNKRWISAFMPNNNFEDGSPAMTNDGTITWNNVDRWFRPEIDFTFNFLNPEDYSECIQIIKGDPFVCRWFDPDIQLWVIRLMKFTDSSLALFLRIYQNNYAGATNYRFKAKSVYTYDTWDQLKAKAENDIRF